MHLGQPTDRKRPLDQQSMKVRVRNNLENWLCQPNSLCNFNKSICAGNSRSITSKGNSAYPTFCGTPFGNNSELVKRVRLMTLSVQILETDIFKTLDEVNGFPANAQPVLRSNLFAGMSWHIGENF